MFRLLRYFSIASFFALLLVTVLLGFLYRRTAIQGLIAQEESKNVAVTKMFVNSLRPQLISYLAHTHGLGADELRTHPALPALRRAVASEIADLPVAKIKLYNIDSLAVFSTEPRQIGEDYGDNEGYMIARTGGVVSELTRSATFSAFDGTLEDQDVLSTYYPVRSGGPTSTIVGVFELYSNVTPLLRNIETTQETIVVGVALIIAILYAVLFLVVRYADSIIRRQHEESLRAEEELRRQQNTLVALRERERLARELHDSVGQVLGYLNIQAQAVSILWVQGQTQEALHHLQRLVEVVQCAQVDVRKQIQSLQSGTAANLDFAAALKQYKAEFRQECNIGVELVNLDKWLDRSVDQDTETELLKIVQEALTNVRKHAHAKHVWVTLDFIQEHALVTVTDDGKGFALDQNKDLANWHFGLRMMYDRAKEIGGGLEVQSAPGCGTRVRLKVPVSHAVRS